jgi:hypothetical protein
MAKILELLQPELDSATFEKVKAIIVANSKMAADDGPASGQSPVKGRNFELACDLLRSKNITEDDIDKLRKICGLEKPTLAEDSARRERNRQRVERDYNNRFPAASRIVGDAAAVAVDRATRAPSSAEKAAYFSRFPEAKRLG